MHTPFRSEADVFKVVVGCGAGALLVIALALLAGPAAGVAAVVALLALGALLTWRSSRGSLPHEVEIAAHDDRVHRVLVVASETVGGAELLGEIDHRCRGHRRTELLVVSPALAGSRLQHLASDTDGAHLEAEARLEQSIATLEGRGYGVRGEVGDSDPSVAIEDALRRFGADEVIISTHPPERSRWLEQGVVERARAELQLPVTHVVVDLERAGAAPGPAPR